jgi:hypothetical protein
MAVLGHYLWVIPRSQGFQPPSGVLDHRIGFALFLDEKEGV